MNTSELLVCIFAFLVGYMLFERCDCTEGFYNINSPGSTIPMVDDGTCLIKNNLYPFIDQSKLSAFTNDLKKINSYDCRIWNEKANTADLEKANIYGMINPDKTKLCYHLYTEGLYNPEACEPYFTASPTPTPNI